MNKKRSYAIDENKSCCTVFKYAITYSKWIYQRK